MSGQDKVIAKLKKYIEGDDWKKLRNKNPAYSQWLENLTEKDISFGEKPHFIKGKVWGNSTAVGESTYGDTTTQRTISMDHISYEYWFVASKNKADKKTLSRAFAKYGFSGRKFYYQNQASDIAKEDGRRKTNESLYDLNFSPRKYRLNRYELRYTSDVISCSLWPIFAKKDDKNEFIGFWEAHNENYIIDLDIKPPMTSKKKFIFLGVAAALVIVALCLLIF